MKLCCKQFAPISQQRPLNASKISKKNPLSPMPVLVTDKLKGRMAPLKFQNNILQFLWQFVLFVFRNQHVFRSRSTACCVSLQLLSSHASRPSNEVGVTVGGLERPLFVFLPLATRAKWQSGAETESVVDWQTNQRTTTNNVNLEKCMFTDVSGKKRESHFKAQIIKFVLI